MSSLEDAFRAVLAARLPKGHAWAAWIDGTAAELAASVEGAHLTHREAQTALGWYADAFTEAVRPAEYDRDVARKLGTA